MFGNYRDTAWAWRRLQPSVLLGDTKDETGLAITRNIQRLLSGEHGPSAKGDGGLCVLLQGAMRLLDTCLRSYTQRQIAG